MATEVKLPQLGQTMEEGTIVSCMVKIDDEIKRGDVVFEIETDKATLEMESPAGGFVKQILAKEGDTIPVGDVVLILGEKDEVVQSASAQADKTDSVTPKKEQAEKPAAAVQAPASAKLVKLPQLGQTMEEGTIVSCMVKIDDKVNRGDVVFEVETDKATLEMESPAEGFVKAVLAKEGQTIPVGDAVLILADKDEQVSQSYIDSVKGGLEAQTAPAGQPTADTKTAAPQAKSQKSGTKVIASPRAKKLAKDMGVDITTITGTGPAGRITEDDVKTAAAAGSKTAVAVTSDIKLGSVIAVNRLQRITAERMLQSKREIPCFYLTVKADVTELVDYRTKLNQSGGVKVAYNDFIVKAVGTGLEHFPIMTGQLDGDKIKLSETINVGLAISVEDGLIAPVLKNVNKNNVSKVAADSKVIINKAKENKLSLDDLEGACCTVSNLGAFGIESFIPVVIPGQCSILGVGQIADVCVPDNGNILTRKQVSLTLSVDHKVANGAYAAQFLDFIKKMLEDPTNFS